MNQILGHDPLVLIQIAGPNGSGKTTFYKQFLKPVLEADGHVLRYINADDIALEIPATEGSSIGLDERVARQAREDADFERELLLREGHKESFLFETVFSDKDGVRLDYLRRAKKAGYSIVMIYIALADVELSMARVRVRVAKGGHDVPEEKQRARYLRSLSNGRAAVEIADLSFILDNSEMQDGDQVAHQPVAVFLGDEMLESIDPAPDWFEEHFTRVLIARKR